MISAPGSHRTRRAPSHHPVGRSCARGRAPGNRTRGDFFGGPGRTADSSALSPVARQGCFHPGHDGAQGKVVGLWYFRARYFDAELGRFIGRDSLGYVDGASLYGGTLLQGLGTQVA
jgi:RHS repeat-associated protein